MKSIVKFNSIPRAGQDDVHPQENNSNINFHSILKSILICVQDSVHIGTKLRNRFLNSSIILQIGNQIASAVHLNDLIEKIAKEVHGLVKTDAYPEDRQNFKSLEKIMNDRVLAALKEHIVDSEGTIRYIELCRDITSAYLDENISVSERIFRIWKSIYFLRCWRKWIQDTKTCTLANNFISLNAYTCVEINGHALNELIVKLRSKKQENMFLPALFSSQPCEFIFRQMRSLGTANYTKINFSMHELLHMISRVELTNKIAYTNETISIPRIQSRIRENLKSKPIESLPSDQEILDIMERARQAAIKEADAFGMHYKENDIIQTELNSLSGGNSAIIETVDIHDLFEDMETNAFVDEDVIAEHSELESLRNTAFDSFVEIIRADGSIEKVKKSTFVWSLTESVDKLSSDRNKRVYGPNSDQSSKKKAKLVIVSDKENPIVKANILSVGSWAIFNNFSIDSIQKCFDANTCENISSNGYLIGKILGFRSVEKGRSKQYKPNHVKIDEIRTSSHSIHVLAVCYVCNKEGILTKVNAKDNFELNLNHYFGTIENPNTEKISEKLVYILPENIMKKISELSKK